MRKNWPMLFGIALTILVNCLPTEGASPTFDITEYGATPNDSTNDVEAFNRALAKAAAAGGGEIYVPPGEYRIVVGELDDPLLEKITDRRYAVLLIRSDRIHIRLDAGATVRVSALYIPQIIGQRGGAPAIVLFHFGIDRAGRRPVKEFVLEGGKWLWEAGRGAKLLEDYDAFNYWQVVSGKSIHAIVRDVTFDGFPSWGVDSGVNLDGKMLTWNRYENVRVLNYGGGGHDNWAYIQGGTEVRNCLFRSARTFQSHTFYFGLDRPGIRIIGNRFENIRTANKTPIDFRGKAGTLASDLLVAENTFYNCNVMRAGYVSGARYARVRIVNNYFVQGGGLQATRVEDLAIAGNTFDDNARLRLRSCRNVTVSENAFHRGALIVAGAQSGPNEDVNILRNIFIRGSLRVRSARLGVIRSNKFHNPSVRSGRRVVRGIVIDGGDVMDITVSGNELVSDDGDTAPLITVKNSRRVRVIQNSIAYHNVNSSANIKPIVVDETGHVELRENEVYYSAVEAPGSRGAG